MKGGRSLCGAGPCPPGTSCCALQRKRELFVEAPGRVGADEAFQGCGKIIITVDRTLGQRIGDVGSRVARPSFDRVEAHDSDRIDVLAGEKALQHGLEVGFRFVRLAPGTAGTRAEVLKDKVDVAVEASGGTIEGEERIRLLRY